MSDWNHNQKEQILCRDWASLWLFPIPFVQWVPYYFCGEVMYGTECYERSRAESFIKAPMRHQICLSPSLRLISWWCHSHGNVFYLKKSTLRFGTKSQAKLYVIFRKAPQLRSTFTSVSRTRRFSDCLCVCSSLAPVAQLLLSKRSALMFSFFSELIHQIMNCFSAGNFFITKFTLKCSPTFSNRSIFNRETHVALKYTEPRHNTLLTNCKWEHLMELITVPHCW